MLENNVPCPLLRIQLCNFQALTGRTPSILQLQPNNRLVNLITHIADLAMPKFWDELEYESSVRVM